MTTQQPRTITRKTVTLAHITHADLLQFPGATITEASAPVVVEIPGSYDPEAITVDDILCDLLIRVVADLEVTFPES